MLFDAISVCIAFQSQNKCSDHIVDNKLGLKKLFGYGGPTDPIFLVPTLDFFPSALKRRKKSYGKKNYQNPSNGSKVMILQYITKN